MIATYVLDKNSLLQKNNDGKNKIPLSSIIEKEISEIFEKSNDYERIKEKLIGETFEYSPEYAYILSGMILKFSYNEKLSEFLKKNTSVIISAFRKSNTKNLRILKHALNDFEKIFESVVSKYENINNEILKTMLTFTLATSFEIKTGSISKEKLKDIKNNDEYISVIYTSDILNNTNNFYLKEFDNKYFVNNFSKYRFFKFIEVYIRTRYFDDRLFKEDIDNAISTLNDEKTDSNKKYLKILNGDYLKLSDSEFEILVTQVLDEVKQGSVLLNDYIVLFGMFKYFIDVKLVIYDLDKLYDVFLSGFKICVNNTVNDLNVLKLNDFKYDDEYIEKLKQEQDKLIKIRIKEIISKKSLELLSYIPQDMSTFYKLIMDEYKEIPVFENIDVKLLYNKLLSVSNYDLNNVINLFKIRYENSKIKSKEKKNMLKLANYINDNISQDKRSLKEILLYKLVNDFNSYF